MQVCAIVYLSLHRRRNFWRQTWSVATCDFKLDTAGEKSRSVLGKQAAALAQEKDSASPFQITNRQAAAAAAMASSNEGESFGLQREKSTSLLLPLSVQYRGRQCLCDVLKHPHTPLVLASALKSRILQVTSSKATTSSIHSSSSSSSSSSSLMCLQCQPWTAMRDAHIQAARTWALSADRIGQPRLAAILQRGTAANTAGTAAAARGTRR
jgi:hypothetical protein